MDKTEYLHRLLELGAKYVFLSRPRRFGKSLFLTMTEEFFKGNKALFEGLAISRYDYDWQTYPILHFDVSGCPIDSHESMALFLDSFLERYESEYGLPTDK